MRHYARNIGDLAAATRGLDLLHRGAYDALLDAYYLREAPLPLDRRECYLLADARTPAERRAVDAIIARFFTESPDGWRQKRCDAEIARWYEKSEKARESSAIAVKVRQANARHIATERSSNGQPNDAPNGQPIGHLPTTHDPRPTTHTPTVPPPSATEPPGGKRVARERAPTPARPARKRPLPPDFAISDRVREWAADKGHTRLDERFEHFVGKARANGYAYADWDEALMTAIRDDWAKLAGKPVANGATARLTPAGQQTAAALQRWAETSEAKDGTNGP